MTDDFDTSGTARLVQRRRIAPTLGLAALVTALVAASILLAGDRGLQASPQADPPPIPIPPATNPVGQTPDGLPDPGAFTEVLAPVVEGALVDYALLQEQRRGLDAWIAALGSTSMSTLEAAPESAQLAFWINAYNACMLKLVVDHYPLEPGNTGLFGAIANRFADRPENSVWQIRNVFSREHCTVAGSSRSQDEIEHEIIRPVFGEPRIHFAVNCAARSCPRLAEEAYRGETLHEQLEAAVRGLVTSPEHFRLVPSSPPVLRLNRVLDWYSEDFGGTDQLPSFFEPYVDEATREHLQRPGISVEFFEYDWTLNDVSRNH